MRTRAQTTRDAALRRLTRVNRSIAVAALVGAGVLTDVVAHTASGHTVKSSTSATGSGAKGTGGVELLTSSRPATHSRRHSARKRPSAAARRQQFEPDPSEQFRPQHGDPQSDELIDLLKRVQLEHLGREFRAAGGGGGLGRELSRCRSPRSAPHPRPTGI